MRAVGWALIQLSLMIVAFAAGYFGRGMFDQEKPQMVMRIPAASGEFQDVEMRMKSSSGPVFRLTCDLFLTADSEPDWIECQYRDP